MRADIDQRAAALFFFVEEYAPCRNGAATDRMRFREVNFAQLAGFDGFFQVTAIRAVTVVVADAEFFACAFRDFEHIAGVGGRFSHRLLAKHVFAGFQRVDGDHPRGNRSAYIHE